MVRAPAAVVEVEVCSAASPLRRPQAVALRPLRAEQRQPRVVVKNLVCFPGSAAAPLAEPRALQLLHRLLELPAEQEIFLVV